jgi:hypothetical protein
LADRPNYKFSENIIIREVLEYVDSTYQKHYATEEGIQATDAIIASGNGFGFATGNIFKYLWRLGKKGGFNEEDVFKIIHYSIILLHLIRKENKNAKE